MCTFLEKESIRCWIAPRDIVPGADYGEAIIKAISLCKIMIVIFTLNANESKFVKKEVERAVSKGAIIIPVRLEDITPTSAMEFFLSSAHWLDAITPPVEKHLNKLTNTIKELLESSKNVLSQSSKERATNDIEDIALFNEIAPDDWYASSKNKFSKWLKNIFSDKT